MREILFRGKRKDNGEWVQGSLSMEYFEECGCVMISPTSDTCYKVVPETIGQFTGLTDMNGKKIFEGDLVNSYTFTGMNDQRCAIVNWDETFSAWHMGEYDTLYKGLGTIYEVIGNIHDNPELLEATE